MEAAAIPLRPVTRRSVLEQARSLPNELPLAALAEARDEPRFVVLLMAALQAGREVDASILATGASLLRDPLYLGAAMGRLKGDVAAGAVAALQDGRVVEPWLGAAMCFFAAVWCQRETRRPPRELVQWTRILARRADDDDATAACAATAKLLEDEQLLTLVAGVSGPDWTQVITETTEWLLAAFVGEPADAVPELAPAVARTGPKIGRNDLCPCGSGKKYKRCHVGKPLPTGPAVGSVDDLQQMSLPELLALDLPTLDPKLAEWVLEELLLLGEVDAVLARVEGADAELVASVRERAAVHRLALGDVPGAKAVIAGLADVAPWLEVGIATPAKAIKALEATAREAIDAVDTAPLVDAAYAALYSPFPALGILVARSVLADARVSDDDAWNVLATLHEARDRHDMGPWDAAATWREGKAPGRVAVDKKALESVRKELSVHEAARREAERAFARSEKERARLESEATRARQEAARAVSGGADAQELAVLRAELQSLKAMHKSIHEERNALRREVAQWRSQAEEEAVEADAVEAIDIDADDDGDGTTAPSGLRVPVLPDGFLEHLNRLPAATGRGALARLGELCSGRPTGWRETKPLQGFDNVWRVKVGRSYRMLFRVHEGRLEVLDLVHRQDLEKKLHQLVALR
jgi:hypothetical protein